MTFPTYFTGAVSVSNGSAAVIGTDTQWQRSNVRQGDRIVIDPASGYPDIMIESVDGITGLTLAQPWTHGNKANVAYKVMKCSIERIIGRLAWEDIDDMIAAMNAQGFFVFVRSDETEPNISLGDEGQYALQPSTRKKWVKEDGEWTYLGVFDDAFSRYDLVLDDPGKPLSGEQLLKWVAPSYVMFRAGLVESRAKSDAAATASATYSLRKNGVEFATMTFANAASTATFACPVDAIFATGDVLTLISPSPQDSTLSGVALTLVGFR